MRGKQVTRSALSRVARAVGVRSDPDRHRDFDPEFLRLIADLRPFTMTSPERLFGLREAVEYVVREQVPGDLVECGVWRGGSSMLIATMLVALGDQSRRLWMYDTYAGMSEPTAVDGHDVIEYYRVADRREHFMAYESLEDVRANLRRTGLAESSIEYVVGRVEDTIPERAPARIALLRLDTDWYQSTAHELAHLYDRVSPGGVIIIDDYGYWQGARRAVDEFFHARGFRPLLSRMDHTGRMIVKPG